MHGHAHLTLRADDQWNTIGSSPGQLYLGLQRR